MASGKVEQLGFITTNSLRQTFNRRVMQPFLDGERPARAASRLIVQALGYQPDTLAVWSRRMVRRVSDKDTSVLTT